MTPASVKFRGTIPRPMRCGRWCRAASWPFLQLDNFATDATRLPFRDQRCLYSATRFSDYLRPACMLRSRPRKGKRARNQMHCWTCNIKFKISCAAKNNLINAPRLHQKSRGCEYSRGIGGSSRQVNVSSNQREHRHALVERALAPPSESVNAEAAPWRGQRAEEPDDDPAHTGPRPIPPR